MLLIGPDALTAAAADGGDIDASDLADLCTDLAAGTRSGVAVITAGLPDQLDGTHIDINADAPPPSRPIRSGSSK